MVGGDEKMESTALLKQGGLEMDSNCLLRPSIHPSTAMLQFGISDPKRGIVKFNRRFTVGYASFRAKRKARRRSKSPKPSNWFDHHINRSTAVCVFRHKLRSTRNIRNALYGKYTGLITQGQKSLVDFSGPQLFLFCTQPIISHRSTNHRLWRRDWVTGKNGNDEKMSKLANHGDKMKIYPCSYIWSVTMSAWVPCTLPGPYLDLPFNRQTLMWSMHRKGCGCDAGCGEPFN